MRFRFLTGTKSVTFSLMLLTSVFSMFISNTAATTMMLPFVDAFCARANRQGRPMLQSRVYSMIAIAYAANVGGTGMLTGSPPNLVLPAVRKTSFMKIY